MVAEHNSFTNRIMALNKKRQLNYFLNFNRYASEKNAFKNFFKNEPTLFYKNTPAGVFFFRVSNKKEEQHIENIITEMTEKHKHFDIYSNSKTLLSRLNPIINRKTNNNLHHLDSKYICFLKNCYTKVVGIKLNDEIANIKTNQKNLEEKEDA